MTSLTNRYHRTSLSRLVTLLLPALLAGGCVAQDAAPDDLVEAVGSEADALTTTGPALGASYGAALPALKDRLGGALTVADDSPTNTTRAVVHDASFTSLANLASKGRLDVANATAIDAFLREQTRYETADASSVAAPLADEQLKAAFDLAVAHNANIEPGALGFFGATTASADRMALYEASRARYLKSRWLPVTANGVTKDVRYDYAQPQRFDEVRNRANRLYCSARDMRTRMGTTSRRLGRVNAAEVSILGRKLELLVLEPTFSLGNPRVVGALNGSTGAGSDAVTVPMMLGTRITPIAGVGLPGLPELRLPISYVGLDSETRNESQWRALKSGAPACVGKFCPPPTYAYERTYDTALHSDGFVFPYRKLEQSLGTFPLFSLGLVNVNAEPSLRFELGDTDFGGKLGVQDGRVFTPRRSGTEHALGTTTYHDGFWAPHYPYNVSDKQSSLNGWLANDASSWLLPFNAVPALTGTRAGQSDDHAVSLGSTATFAVKVIGEGGISMPRVQVTAGIHGKISASASQAFDLREGLLMQKTNGVVKPVGALSIAPRTLARAQVDSIALDLKMAIDLEWFTLDLHFNYPIVENLELASWDTLNGTTWDAETSRARMGHSGSDTSATVTGRTKPKSVAAHLPGGPGESVSSYEPFANQSVETCMAAPALVLPDPPSCGPVAATKPKPTPSAEICLYAGTGLSEQVKGETNLCETQTGDACLDALLGWLCEPVSREQLHPTLGYTTVARVLAKDPLSLEKQLIGLASSVGQCGLDPQAAQTFVETYLKAGACTSDARILGTSELVATTRPANQAPTVGAALPCN